MRRRGERVLGPYRQPNGWRIVRIDATGKRESRVYETMDVAECMKTSPDAPRPPRHRTEAREGLLYVVSLVPEARPLRIKIGFTSAGIEKRMDAFRTPCPTAVLVCAWPALSSDERRVLAALPGRIGQSEVFACDDVDVLVRKIMRTLAAA